MERATSPKRPVSGLGPHGEFAASADQLRISDAAAARAAQAHFAVAVVLHSADSDWSRLQAAGIADTLARVGAHVKEVVHCGFRPERQVAALEALLERRPDAIISLPIDTVQAAEAHRRVTQAGVKLVLMDNAPVGLVARKDYVTLVSADNFGNGEIAAEILADHIPAGGTVCVVRYAADFHVTDERELGFRRSMREHRPEVHIEQVEYGDPELAGDVVLGYLATRSTVDGLFVVWDEPAILTARALRAAHRMIPITTVDLGMDVALEIATDGLIKGAGAQLPYDQGVAEATAAIMALAGEEPPTWIALPALAVTRRNVVEAYESVWHRPAPADLRDALTRA
jgi:ribose transport system substrate-binding protein